MHTKRVQSISKFTIMLDEARIVYRTLIADGEITILVRALGGPNSGGDEGAETQFVFDLRTGRLLCLSCFGPLVEDREDEDSAPMSGTGKRLIAS